MNTHYTPIWDDFAFTAKIDLITTDLLYWMERRDVHPFVNAIQGRVNFSRRSRDFRLTIHDPSKTDLQFLIDHYHRAAVLALEIAVDFSLKDGSSDPIRLTALRSHLARCLHPQKHRRLASAQRYYFDPRDHKIKPDTLMSKSDGSTLYWYSDRYGEQVRLYLKTRDNDVAIPQHVVRAEITLKDRGIIKAEADRIGLLPHFVREVGLRSFLTPYFNVGRGAMAPNSRVRSNKAGRLRSAAERNAKSQDEADRVWAKGGALWAVKRGYTIVPDRQANAMIGAALKKLRESLLDLKLPEKVACDHEWETDWILSDKSIPELMEWAYRRGDREELPRIPSRQSPSTLA